MTGAGARSSALALINPIDWPEPFGLVMAEVLACGTPVVARWRGSVPEVVAHGQTGFIGESDEEPAKLCGQARSISRAACRAEAERCFSVTAMADGYEAAYRPVLGEEPGISDGLTGEAADVT